MHRLRIHALGKGCIGTGMHIGGVGFTLIALAVCWRALVDNTQCYYRLLVEYYMQTVV